VKRFVPCLFCERTQQLPGSYPAGRIFEPKTKCSDRDTCGSPQATDSRTATNKGPSEFPSTPLLEQHSNRRMFHVIRMKWIVNNNTTIRTTPLQRNTTTPTTTTKRSKPQHPQNHNTTTHTTPLKR